MTHSITEVLFLLLFFLFFIGNSTFCQSNHNINFTTINHTNGLPNNTINAIAKDDLGFVWIGTNDGLCRYETSNSIKVFRTNNPKIEGGIESSNIRSLFLDSKDNLWIGTRLGGLTQFHQPSNTWKTFRHDNNNPASISNDEILTITEDRKGRLWVGTEDGLNVFDYETESFVSFKSKDEPGELVGKAVLTIIEDDKGWIWAGTWAGGLNLLIPSAEGIEKSVFRTFFPNEKAEAKHIWKIFQDRQNRYWVGSRGAGLFIMDLPENANNDLTNLNWQPKFHSYIDKNDNSEITSNNIQDIFQDRNGNLWVGTVKGLNFIAAEELSTKTNNNTLSEKIDFTFQHYFSGGNNQSSITNNDISTIFEDSQGLVWFGTFSGISIYNWFINQFDVFELDGIISGNNTQNIYIDRDGIGWLGNGEKGVFKYDFKKQKRVPFEGDEILMLNSFVSAIYSPDDKHLYIGTGNGITKLNMETNHIKNYPIPSTLRNQLNYFFIRSFFRDDQDRLWIASEQGLYVVDEKTGNYLFYLHDPNNPKSISDVAINHIMEDSNKDIWIATFNGLNKVIRTSSDKIEFERFKHDTSDPENSIPSNRIVALEEIDGILYIGSSDGLSGYNLKEKTFTNYSKENNKYSFQSLEKSADGNLWAGTTEGIVFFNAQTHTFNQYEKADGLGDIIFQIGSSHRDENGFFYFGSGRGVTRFNPQNLLRNEVPPGVYVTDIRKMSPEGEERLSGIYAKEIVLEHNEYYLALDFTALNYNRSEKNKYAFMLEGFENNWNYSDDKSPVVYTNLKHGEYNFRVKAANNDGVWNEEGTVLRVIKKPAYWETWWFRLGVSFFVISMLYKGVSFYTKNIKERNKVLQKYNEDLNKEIAQRKIAEAALQEQKQQLRKSNEDIQKSNKDLERSNKDLEQFAYIASHDLQEPLRVVGNFIGLLKRRYKQHFDEEAFQYIDFAVDGVSRMSQQIKSILTFSRVSQKDIEFRLTNLNHVLFTKLHDLSQNIEEKKVQIIKDEMPEIICEKNQIEMVFHNLISNAIKFNKKESPSVIISNNTIASGEFWQFSVKDNGIGIAPEYQKQIFEIFRRLHNKQDYEGTGIGLALCQKIIHRHGGEIWVESKQGEGTTFYFTISKKLKTKASSKKENELKKILYN